LGLYLSVLKRMLCSINLRTLNLFTISKKGEYLYLDLFYSLLQNWPGKDTKSIFNEVCTICGTTSSIEMHHIKSVKKIRAKYRAGEKVTYAEFKGAILRKQIPLCAYHHRLYHKGELNYSDLALIARYRKAH